MQENVKNLLEGFYKDDLDIIRPALVALLTDQDEDMIVIVIREVVASGHLKLSGESKTATIIGGIILDSEPKRSLLAKFARRLNDSISSDEYLQWMDGILARNLHLEVDELTKEWAKLEAVQEIRRVLSNIKGGDN